MRIIDRCRVQRALLRDADFERTLSFTRLVGAALAAAVYVASPSIVDGFTAFGLLAGGLLASVLVIGATMLKVRMHEWKRYGLAATVGAAISVAAVFLSGGKIWTWTAFALFVLIGFAGKAAPADKGADFAVVFGISKIHPNSRKFLGLLGGCGGTALGMAGLGQAPDLLGATALVAFAVAAVTTVAAEGGWRFLKYASVAGLAVLFLWRGYPSPFPVVPASIMYWLGSEGWFRVMDAD